MISLYVLDFRILLLVPVIDFANLDIGLTNIFLKQFLLDILTKFVLSLGLLGRWIFICLICIMAYATSFLIFFLEKTSSTRAVLLILTIKYFSTEFLQWRLQGFSLQVSSCKSLSVNSNEYFINRLTLYLLLLIIGLLAMRTWYIQKSPTLKYLDIPI